MPANLGAHPTSIFIEALSCLYRNAKKKGKSAKKDVPEYVKLGRRLHQHKLRKMLEMEIKHIEEINQNKTKDIDSLIEKYLVKLRSQCLSEDEMKHVQRLNKEKRD